MGASSTPLSPRTTGKIKLSPLALSIGDVGNPVATSFDIPSTYSASRLCDALEGKSNCEVDGLDRQGISIPATTGGDEMTRWRTTVASINDDQGGFQLAFKRPHAGDNGVSWKRDSEMAIYGSDESEPLQGGYPRPLQETNPPLQEANLPLQEANLPLQEHVAGNNRASPYWQRLREMVKDQQELSHLVGTTRGVQENRDDGEQCHVLERVASKGEHTGNDGQDRTETTCVKSWRQRERDEAKAKEEARLAQVKRAERVREVRNVGRSQGFP